MKGHNLKVQIINLLKLKKGASKLSINSFFIQSPVTTDPL